MKTTPKSPKPYWEMNKDELGEATKEFDRELVNDTFRPLGPEKLSLWNSLQNGVTPDR